MTVVEKEKNHHDSLPASDDRIGGLLLCKGAVQIAPTITGEIMYLPAGLQEITPWKGGSAGKPIKVLVDPESVTALEQQRETLEAHGKQIYFDFNHADGAASFWPDKFFWRPEGIFASGEWTARGKQSVEGKEFREFAPIFHVDNKNGDLARIVCFERANPNMGGLVNNAAFRNILPLWAKHAGAPSEELEENQNKKDNMKTSPSLVSVEAEAPRAILEAFARNLALNAAIRLSSDTYRAKGRLAREAATIFAKDIEKNPAITGMRIDDAVKAADVTDVQVGLLAGTLVLQRALPLLQFQYPELAAVASDFSDAPGLFNQTETTRIIVKPAVQSYDTTLDTSGRPKGWSLVSPAQSVDVPIKLDEYLGVPIVFGVETLAQTVRRLFDEQAPQALYAIGGYFVKKLLPLFTAANYNAYAATSVGSGATTSGSNAASAASTANMYPGQAISGTGIPATCYVQSIVDSTNFTLTQKATATNTGLTFALGPGFDDAGVVLPIPTLYSTFVSALADFNMASLGLIRAAFSAAMVPTADRAVLINSAYYQRLAEDPTFNTFFAATRKPEIITEGQLPRLQGLDPIEAPYFPSSNNRVGFAFHKAAALIKTRLPQDFIRAVGAMVPGSVTTVTAPSGLSVLLVQYVNLQNNYAEWRPEVMISAATGDRRAGLVITSQ